MSVHQGKGLEPVAAQIGACIEAIECACAESWTDPRPLHAAFDALPRERRAPSPDDFAITRGALAADVQLAWTLAEPIGNGPGLWVPVSAVSLDLTIASTPGVERSSNGQGGGIDLDHATLKALCELVERDAFQAWSERPALERAADAIDAGSIDYSWLAELRTRWRKLGVIVRIFRMPAVVDMPTIAVELLQIGEDSACRKRAIGTCVHPDPERALLGAVLEAAQARLGEIAGSREDIDPDRPEIEPGRINFAPPAPGLGSVDFHLAWHEPHPIDAAGHVQKLTEALSRAGYPQTARIELSPPGAAIKIVKLFTPGLGALGRSRRAPIH